MKTRKAWLDIAKGIAMCCIVFSHTNAGTAGWYKQLYEPVFLSVFFFSSGYLFREVGIRDELKYVLRHLVLPLITLGTINAFISLIIEHEALIPRLRALYFQTSGTRDDMWFIACMASAHIIFWIIYRICRKNESIFTIVVVSTIVSLLGGYYGELINFALPWKIQRAVGYILFICLGYVYRKYEHKFNEKVSKKTVVGIACIYFLGCFEYGGGGRISARL